MANFPSEGIRINTLYLDSATIGTSLTGKTRYFGQGDISVVCMVHAGTLATGLNASAAGGYDFTVTESTAASVTGSNIARATLNLGAATAMQVYGGGNNMILWCNTAMATTVGITINGITYHGTAVGATANNGALQISRAINGKGSSVKLPHYRAVPETTAGFTAKNLLRIEADDDYGTGLTVEASAAAGTCLPYMTELQGVINISAGQFSTNSPKYIGITFTPLTGLATGAAAAIMLSYPTATPAFNGKVVNVNT